jgi:hypothetical protein
MKGFCLAILLMLTAGVAYCAYRDGTLRDVLAGRESPQYVEREAAPAGRWDMSPRELLDLRREQYRQCVRERDEDARHAHREYDEWRRRGVLKTGVRDVDDYVAAFDVLDGVSGQYWPERWRERKSAGAAWCDREYDAARKRDPGPDEECTDWQGRDQGMTRRQARPEWVEPKREGQTRRAFRHLLFGVDENEP